MHHENTKIEIQKWYVHTFLGRLCSLIDSEADVLLSLPFYINSKECEVALIQKDRRICAIRIGIPGDGNLNEIEMKEVSELKQHMVAVLRLTFDPAIAIARIGEDVITFGTHSDEYGNSKFGIKVDAKGERLVDLKSIAATFNSTADTHRPFVQLLADAMSPYLPPQFRFLSVYKIFELEFRKNRKWQDFASFATVYENEFASLNLTNKKLENFLHEFRDRCAHIHLGRNDELGVTGLDVKDTQLVQNFMPLLIRMIGDLATIRHKITLVISAPSKHVM